jgi:hypothetical protein
MQRYRQTESEILSNLTKLESSWQDAHALKIIGHLSALPTDTEQALIKIEEILDEDFDCGADIVRLVLDLSADEFRAARRGVLGSGIGIIRFRQDKAAYMKALGELGLSQALHEAIHRPLHWSDILVERLKAGRGSAIKGQKRGLSFENSAEAVVKSVFGPGGYDIRCRFVGRNGRETETEKADFAIPTRQDPRILIEAKAYGATGSKQTDVIGDIQRIAAQKRDDTALLVVTDGITWNDRVNDVRKLVHMQNCGTIARIYTTRMFGELQKDLEDLRRDHHLPQPPEPLPGA